MTARQDLIDLAISKLDDSRFWDTRDRGAFTNGGQHWLIDGDDLEDIGAAYLADEQPDFDAMHSMTEVDLTDVVCSHAITDISNLDALRDEAGAAGDWVSYVALEHWRGEVEYLVEERTVDALLAL